MENNQDMLMEKLGVFEEKMGLENNQIILMEKLGFLGILKEAIKIPFKCPKFIFLTFLISLPLIFLMVLHEIILQASLIQTKSFITKPSIYYDDEYIFYSVYSYYYHYNELYNAKILFRMLFPSIFQLGFLYLVPLHLLNLLTTIVTVNAASAIYGERPMRLKEMLLLLINKNRFMGPLITSIYVLFLNSFILFGMIWAVTNAVIGDVIIYGVISIILTVKWIEWSAVWNMGIVFSVFDERHGIDALGISGNFSRGNRKHGFQLMLLFFVWRIILRFSCFYFYIGGGHARWVGLVATAFLSCIGNVMKWVVCTVYFYDCKRRVLEKKVDLEQGREVKNTNTGQVVEKVGNQQCLLL